MCLCIKLPRDTHFWFVQFCWVLFIHLKENFNFFYPVYSGCWKKRSRHWPPRAGSRVVRVFLSRRVLSWSEAAFPMHSYDLVSFPFFELFARFLPFPGRFPVRGWCGAWPAEGALSRGCCRPSGAGAAGGAAGLSLCRLRPAGPGEAPPCSPAPRLVALSHLELLCPRVPGSVWCRELRVQLN